MMMMITLGLVLGLGGGGLFNNSGAEDRTHTTSGFLDRALCGHGQGSAQGVRGGDAGAQGGGSGSEEES